MSVDEGGVRPTRQEAKPRKGDVEADDRKTSIEAWEGDGGEALQRLLHSSCCANVCFEKAGNEDEKNDSVHNQTGHYIRQMLNMVRYFSFEW